MLDLAWTKERAVEAPSKKPIFLVEDSKEIRQLIQILFESEGYRVECAEDGRQALDKLRGMEPLPGMILLDLMMPVMDGFQFRQEQAGDPRLSHVPVLVLTADSSASEKVERMNVQGSLKKPVDVDTLLAAAEKWCN